MLTSKEVLKTLRGYLGTDTKIIELLIPIAKDLEVLEKLEAKTHLLFKDRKTIAKEFDKWCEDNNVVNCSESMATWFLSIKLKEWLKNE